MSRIGRTRKAAAPSIAPAIPPAKYQVRTPVKSAIGVARTSPTGGHGRRDARDQGENPPGGAERGRRATAYRLTIAFFPMARRARSAR
jgi:hypothetical protein